MGENKKVYVGNVPDHVRRTDLQDYFSKYGSINECDIVRDYAFIHFDSSEDARVAVQELDGKKWHDKILSVQLSRSKGHGFKSFAGGRGGGGGGGGFRGRSPPPRRRSPPPYRGRSPPYRGRSPPRYRDAPPSRSYDRYDRPMSPPRDYYSRGPPAPRYRSRSPYGGGGGRGYSPPPARYSSPPRSYDRYGPPPSRRYY